MNFLTSALYYKLKHLPPSSEQGLGDHYHELIKIVLDQIKTLQAPIQFSPKQKKALLRAYNGVNGLRNSDNPFAYRWFPEYACVLLVAFHRIEDKQNLDTCGCTMHLLGLDNWDMHPMVLNANVVNHHSEALGHKIYYVGHFENIGILEKVMNTFDMIFNEVRNRKGNDRHALLGENGGHQKTPSFIYACLGSAIEQTPVSDDDTVSLSPLTLCFSIYPKGGMTDVGLHTGGNQRNVTWPLVRQTFRHLISIPEDDANVVFQRFMLCLHYYIFSNAINQLCQRTDLSANDLDELCEVVVTMGDVAISLNNYFHIVRNCTTRIDELLMRFLDSQFESKVMTPDHMVTYPAELEEPSFLMSESLSSESFEEIRNRALANIGQLSFHLGSFAEEDEPFKSLWTWMGNYDSDDRQKSVPTTQKLILIISVIDDFIATLCLKSLDDNIYNLCKPFSGSEFEIAYQVIEKYYNIVKEICKNIPDFVVDLSSMEMLNTWSMTCLLHCHSCYIHPLLKEYKLPIDRHNLQHLVLKSKKSWDLARITFLYLAKVDEKASRPPIFKIGDDAGTIRFSLEYSLSQDTILNHLEKERIHSKAKEDKWYKMVLQKKEKLKNLDVTLQSQLDLLNETNSSLHSKRSQYEEFQKYMRKGLDMKIHNPHYSEFHTLQQEAFDLETLIAETRSDITANECAPTFITHALPQNRDLALVALFHMFFIPVDIEYVSRFVFASQTMLFANRQGARKGPEFITSWVNHYSGRGMYQTEKNRYSILFPIRYNLPRSHGPTNVRLISCSSEGQWYPEYSSSLALPSGLNPFRFNDEDHGNISLFYTDKIESLYQWSMNPPQVVAAKSSTRGNLAYSKEIGKYTKVEHIAIGDLRSYPIQQIRKLISGINRKTLPLMDIDAQKLILQALFQIGEIREGGSFLWKADLFYADGSGFKAMYDTLRAQAYDLKNSQSKHQSHVVLAAIASFCMQHKSMLESDCEDLEMLFVSMAEDWANDNLEQAVKGAATKPRSILASLKSKASLFFGYCSCCVSTADDIRKVAKIIKHNILFNHYHCFLSELDASDSVLRDQCLKIKPKVLFAMSRVIAPILSTIESLDPSIRNQLLTESIRFVFESAPKSLEWNRIKTSCCFEAIDHEVDSHYSVNIFTGTILFDGAPPCRLPTHILSNRLYKNMFGDYRDFDVSLSKDMVFKSLSPLDGYFYKFSIVQSGLNSHLKVIEIDERTKMELELLDFQDRLNWWPELPIRLKLMFCHWYHKSSGTIIMRPVYDSLLNGRIDRAVHAFAIISDKERAAFDVPTSMRNNNWLELVKNIETLESFELLNSNVDVFNSFENPKYVHIFRCRKTSCIRVHLPRYQLSFIKERNHRHFVCKEYPDYHLAEHQVLRRTLPFYEHYLVLESAHDTRLLVPYGRVLKNCDRKMTRIETDDIYSSNIKYFIYELNPRTGFLTGNRILAQLHWAAILSASGSNVRDPLMGMTGSEAAMSIVRQCFCTRPLSQQESDCLQDVIFHSHREPGLKILCKEFQSNAYYLSFLHEPYVRNKDTDWLSGGIMEYEDLEVRKILNPRRRVNDEESSFLSIKKRTKSSNSYGQTTHNFGPDLVPPSFVAEAEDTLQSTVTEEKSSTTPEFPLTYGYESALNEILIGDLKSSWEKYHDIPSERIENFEALKRNISTINDQLRGHIDHLDNYFEKISVETNHAALKMEIAINRMPKWCFRDLLMFIYISDDVDKLKHREFLRQFFPCIDDSSVDFFREAAIKYVELCILQDKLSRIDYLIQDGRCNDVRLIRELRCKRIWDSRNHLRWLVFEAESGIQIRPEQYTIAKHLLEHPGIICQLNMGYGKTRVIAPMLIIEMTKYKNRLIRLFTLPAILNEAIDFMQEALMIKSVLQVRIFSQPFHRQISLDSIRINRIRHMAEKARTIGGFMLLAPEHKLSLELKLLEMRFNNYEENLVKQLRKITECNLNYDILDEGDQILSNKYHLVYAIEGDMQKKIPLEDGPNRWIAAQSLLNVLSNSVKIAEALQVYSQSAPGGFHVESGEIEHGKYRQIRFTEALSISHKQFREELKILMLNELISDPPHELHWMKEVADTLIPREILIQSIIDVNVGLDEHLSDYMDFFYQHTSYFSTILVLRGLLGCHLLEHCLQLRYRVDYGLDPRRKKALAVPYKAADLPSYASEFSHPDVGIVKTILSYYHKGLTREQLSDCMKSLIGLGPSAQKSIYETWFNRVKDNIDPNDLAEIDSHTKIDVTNASQINILHKVFCFCMETIDFWLNNYVFPRDTVMYPFRICKSAFDIAHREAVGFSGTKDMRLLHPIQMSQCEPDDKTLIGTDGKMLSLILKKSQFKSLHVNGEIWKGLLDMALHQKVNALIDSGSLLAGVLNKDAASYLRRRLQHSNNLNYRGIIYFETRSKRIGGEWMTMNLETGETVCKADSSVKDSEAFIIFDDARTRGVDMKMSPYAIALLTLGPNLIKDKLMQSAGRLRQLEGGQELIITATQETEAQIKAYSKDDGVSTSCVNSCMNVIDILQWTLENTKKATVQGLSSWATNGMIYDKSKKNEDDALIKEDWSLKTLYGSPLSTSTLDEVINKQGRKLGTYLKTKGYSLEFLESLLHHSTKYGQNVEVIETTADHSEECEREMQLEKEVEEEREVEKAHLNPVSENVWNYNAILSAKRVEDVKKYVMVKAFSEISGCSPEISDIAWHRNLFGTCNFFKTITGFRENTVSMVHARSIGQLIILKNGEWIALSDQEAEGILRAIILNPSRNPNFLFVNCQSLLYMMGCNDLSRGNQALGTQLHDNDVIASLSLYNGETGFINDSVVSAVIEILRNSKAKKQIEDLVKAKGLYHFYSRSKLESICNSALYNT